MAFLAREEESLEAILNADHPEERSWAAGEALAEAYLTREHGVVFPWNMERDKRNPLASLPGADIIGFVEEAGSCRFALGEVKSSQEEKAPPQIMSGRTGHLGHQIEILANNLTSINQLMRWLLVRVKGTSFEGAFTQSATTFLNSGNKSTALFGVLIRDTSPKLEDLSGRGQASRFAGQSRRGKTRRHPGEHVEPSNAIRGRASEV